VVFTVAVRQRFRARHALLVPSGPEASPHAHDYLFELVLEGARLGPDGYLVDIDLVKHTMRALVERHAGRMLNDAPELRGLNPSLENFARVLWTGATTALTGADLTRVRVVLWEDEEAWAAYEG
jgi:6-pyruvoyltetrahydropterin/6-carboxytetrahydropterin synthase